MVRRPARMSPEARAWYLAEISYLADRNPEAAARVIDMMQTARQNLADNPRLGPRLGAVGRIPGTRRLVVRPYVLTTRQGSHGIEIVAIRHARQGDAYAPSEARTTEDGEPE